MRTLRTLGTAMLALWMMAQGAHAQILPFSSLPFSLFERYLDGLRQQAGIPGLSAAILQSGQVVWERGLGYRDAEAFQPASADTPYPILDLSQTISSTMLLQQCVEYRYLQINDRVRRWSPQYPEEGTTVGHLLSHLQPASGFRYDAGRYAALTDVIEQCTSDRYSQLLSENLINRFGMRDTVPGRDAGGNRQLFSSATAERFAAVLRRVAVPYRVDSRGRAIRSDYAGDPLSASTGVVSTVRDLARFDAALDSGALLSPAVRSRAWEPMTPGPTGLGWFAQPYDGERIIWHFGLVRDAYSALYIKVPNRGLTLVLLANSDGLAAPYNLSNGDVTTSLFAQLFLKLFVT